MNKYNIDELRYYSLQTFNCWNDLRAFSIVDSEKFVYKFTVIWTPTTPQHVE
jgi:hypothetical protein